MVPEPASLLTLFAAGRTLRFIKIPPVGPVRRGVATQTLDERDSQADGDVHEIGRNLVEKIDHLRVKSHDYLGLREPRILNDDPGHFPGRKFRNISGHPHPDLIGGSLEYLRLYRPAKYPAHVYLDGHQLSAQGFGKAREGELARAASGFKRDSALAHNRGDVDAYAAQGLCAPPGNAGLTRVDGSPEIHIHHPPEVVNGLIGETGREAHARVVDQSVYATESLHRFRDQSLDLLLLGHIGLDGERIASPRFDLGRQLQESLFAAAGDDYASARAGEPQGRLAA